MLQVFSSPNILYTLNICNRDLVGTQNACVTMSDLSLLCHKLRESRRHSDYDKRCLPFEESEQFGVFCLEISLLNCYGLQLLHKVHEFMVIFIVLIIAFS